jgi:hypothetical protein
MNKAASFGLPRAGFRADHEHLVDGEAQPNSHLLQFIPQGQPPEEAGGRPLY